MNKKFDNNKLPSPEEMDRMIHMMEQLRDKSVGICMAMQERITDRKNRELITGEPQDVRQELVGTYHLEEMKTQYRHMMQMVNDTILVLEEEMMRQAMIVHQALRQASRTDPSLLDAVKELDELYEEALKEQNEQEDNLLP